MLKATGRFFGSSSFKGAEKSGLEEKICSKTVPITQNDRSFVMFADVFNPLTVSSVCCAIS